MQTLGVGIIGFGFMGRTHAYGYRNLPVFYDPVPCHTRLVGVATGHRQTAEAARRALEFELATTDWRELLDRRDIHILHVCTPNALHKEQVLAALASGKHVYCDKPLCMNREEAREIEAVLPAARVTHQMALHNRFFPATMRAKALVEQGLLGDVLGLRAAYLHSGSADPEAPLKWKLDPAMAGGGALLDLGVHVLDLVQHLVGPIRILNCTTHIAYPQRPAAGDPGRLVRVALEDAAFLTVQAGNGAPGHIEASKIATGAVDELRFEINGSRGALRFDLMQPNYLWVYDRTSPVADRGWQALETAQSYPPPAIFPPPKMSVGWLRGHVACLHSFLVAVASGEPAEPSLQVGVELQYLMAEAYDLAGCQ
jgi:predicted dehydrogenase